MANVVNPTDYPVSVPSLDLRLEPGPNEVTDEQAAAFVGHPIIQTAEAPAPAVTPEPEAPVTPEEA